MRGKTKAQLLDEVGALRQQVADLQAVVAAHEQAEEALRESEERYRDLVENSEDLICTHDLDGLILSVNPMPAKILGYDPGVLVNKKTIRDLLAPEFRSQFDRYLDTIKREGVATGVMVVQTKGGERRIWEYHNTLRTVDVASPLVRGMAHDITKRKHAEDALRERVRLAVFVADVSRALTQGVTLRDILQHCTEALVRNLDAAFARIWTLNPQEDVLELRASAGLYTHLDGAHSRIPIGQFKIGLIAQERKPHLTNAIIGDPRVHDQEWAKREGMVAFAGYPLLIEDRAVGVIAMFARHALTDATLQALAAVADEIAVGVESKTAEAALQQEAQISSALAQAGHAIIMSSGTPEVLDRLCRLVTDVLACDSSYALLWQPQTAVFVPVATHGHLPEQAEEIRALKMPRDWLAPLLAQFEQQNVVPLEVARWQSLPIMQVARQYGMTSTLYVALRQGSEVIGILTAAYRGRSGVFTVQHERILQGIGQLASLALQNVQLLDELQRANRLKDDFLATMSHELRTPLNIILGYTGLLLEEAFGPLAPKQAEYLRRVDKNARQLSELIVATLDISRLEAGRLPVQLQEVQLPELLHELDMEVQELLREKPGLRFTWQVSPELPQLRTDRTKLKVVLKNLVSNAIKFTPAGQVSLDAIGIEKGVEIRVRDTGIGIAPEVQSVMFEMFRQGESATTRRHGGVGLGLYIVKRLLELVGGTVTAESKVGHGSTFRVWLPDTPDECRQLTPRGKTPLDPLTASHH